MSSGANSNGNGSGGSGQRSGGSGPFAGTLQLTRNWVASQFGNRQTAGQPTGHRNDAQAEDARNRAMMRRDFTWDSPPPSRANTPGVGWIPNNTRNNPMFLELPWDSPPPARAPTPGPRLDDMGYGRRPEPEQLQDQARVQGFLRIAAEQVYRAPPEREPQNQ